MPNIPGPNGAPAEEGFKSPEQQILDIVRESQTVIATGLERRTDNLQTPDLEEAVSRLDVGQLSRLVCGTALNGTEPGANRLMASEDLWGDEEAMRQVESLALAQYKRTQEEAIRTLLEGKRITLTATGDSSEDSSVVGQMSDIYAPERSPVERFTDEMLGRENNAPSHPIDVVLQKSGTFAKVDLERGLLYLNPESEGIVKYWIGRLTEEKDGGPAAIMKTEEPVEFSGYYPVLD
jgi:hypothetical protein